MLSYRQVDIDIFDFKEIICDITTLDQLWKYTTGKWSVELRLHAYLCFFLTHFRMNLYVMRTREILISTDRAKYIYTVSSVLFGGTVCNVGFRQSWYSLIFEKGLHHVKNHVIYCKVPWVPGLVTVTGKYKVTGGNYMQSATRTKAGLACWCRL